VAQAAVPDEQVQGLEFKSSTTNKQKQKTREALFIPYETCQGAIALLSGALANILTRCPGGDEGRRQAFYHWWARRKGLTTTRASTSRGRWAQDSPSRAIPVPVAQGMQALRLRPSHCDHGATWALGP
jgi:hypothetical protein